MPVLTPGKTVRSARPTLLVENKLAAGAHRFELVVVDNSGNASAPAFLTVTVRGPRTPPVRGVGGTVPTPAPPPPPPAGRPVIGRIAAIARTPAPPASPPKPPAPPRGKP